MIPLLGNSQSISKGERLRGEYRTSSASTYMRDIPRGTIIGTADSAGNMYLHMHIEDAKIFLTDLLDYELIVDSILPGYTKRASLQTSAITLNIKKIKELQKQSELCDEQNLRLQGILNNLEEIGTFKDLTIENVEKQVRREKLKKTFGFIGAGLGGLAAGIIVGFTLR